MTYSSDIKIVDLLLGIPTDDSNSSYYEWIKPMLMDDESHQQFSMPAQYMFKDSVPKIAGQPDYIAYTVEQMDKHNIAIAMTGIGDFGDIGFEAVKRYPDRFVLSYEANPYRGMKEVRIK